MTVRMRFTSSSLKSRTRLSTSTPASPRILFDRERPIPKIYVRPISARLFAGRSTPAMRAILPPCLTLPLLVLRVSADHPDHASAVNNLAIVTHFLYRCPDLHFVLPSRDAVALARKCRGRQTVILPFVVVNRQPPPGC